MAQEQPAPRLRNTIGNVGMVDLLRQRLDGFEAEEVQGEAGSEHERCGATEHGDDGEGGEGGEGGHPGQPRGRVAGETAQPSAHDGLRSGRLAGEQRPMPIHGVGARALAAQLAAQQHDGAQVLDGDGEAQLRHEIGAPGQRLEAQTIGDDESADSQ